MLNQVKLIFVGLLILTSLVYCSAAKKTAVNDDKDFRQIGTFLQSLVDTAGIPGIAIAITKDKETVYAAAFGQTNVNTKKKLDAHHTFHIASVSKTFAATAVMQLQEKGKLDINQTLVTYLPYFMMKDPRYSDISIKQLLNHSSGMPDVNDYEWHKEISDEGAAERLTRSLKDSMLISSPGAEYHYSNIGYDLLADLIARVSGSSFEKYVKENILLPLEMNESSFFYPEVKKSLRTSPHTGNPPAVMPVYPYNRMHAPSSTLNSNVLEMAHWAIANIYNGNYKGTGILSPQTHALMMTPGIQTNKERNISIGLSWFMYPHKGMMNYEHGGSDDGYKSLLTLIPENKIGIIILSNIENIKMYDTRNKIREILLAKYNDPIR